MLRRDNNSIILIRKGLSQGRVWSYNLIAPENKRRTDSAGYTDGDPNMK